MKAEMIKKLSKKNLKEMIKIQILAETPVYKKARLKFNKKEIKEYIQDTLKKGKIFGYFLDNKLVAIGGIAFEEGYGELRHLFTLPKFQKKGIATKLMNHLEKYAKKKTKNLKLNVLIKNPAVKFYEKRGYKKYVYVLVKRLR